MTSLRAAHAVDALDGGESCPGQAGAAPQVSSRSSDAAQGKAYELFVSEFSV